MPAAAIKATYSEWKMVKTRKVLVLSFEVPLEQQAEVIAALGVPMPDTSIWVAIARLNETAGEARGGRLAQQAGILCNEGAFIKWMGAKDADGAAELLREHCGVLSRANLDSNEEAARKFLDLKTDYQIWLRDAA
jgi:hypothetical protein